MESWLQRIFLRLAPIFVALALGACIISPAFAQDDDEEEDASEEETIFDGVIKPDIERRNIVEDRIDTEDWEFGMFAGNMNIEDFGSNDMFGVRFGYLITEDFFLELTGGSTRAGKTSFELLSGGTDLLTEDERDYYYYNISLGINIFHGEIFVGKHLAFNTAYYIIGGAGNTLFAGNEYFTSNYGGGFKLFLTDWSAVRFDVRNHIFTHNILGADKTVQNLEAHMGLSIYF